MKKVSFLGIAAMALAGVFSGCSTEDTATPLNVDWSQTATINGTLLIITDQSSANPYTDAKWKVIDSDVNIKQYFVAEVPYSALNPGANGTYVVKATAENFTYDEKGQFSFKVPAGKTAASIKVKMLPWQGQVKYLKFASIGEEKIYPVIWDEKTGTESVAAGETKYLPAWKLYGGYTPLDAANDPTH
jgi:hypothetical protein